MRKKELKYIYGPVPSWRLGSSLGIDPISMKDKICTFDCSYCQLGRTIKYSDERKIYAATDKIIEELISLQPVKIDYITFSGRGEPTLAKNLGEMIRSVKTLWTTKIAVITNSSIIYRKDVISDLLTADFVIAKMDAYSQESLEKINKPIKSVNFKSIADGLKTFRQNYKGKFALQIMFSKDNIINVKDLYDLAAEICPDEIQINTPLRPCSVKPLSKTDIDSIKEHFKEMNSVSVYDALTKKVKPISSEDTLKRRGKI